LTSTLLIQEDNDRFSHHSFLEVAEDRYLGIQMKANSMVSILPHTMETLLQW